MESKSWTRKPLQLTSRHQPGGLAALAVDEESECVVVMGHILVSIPSRGSMGTARVMAALVECKVMDVCGGVVNVSETNSPRRNECIWIQNQIK
ncbi:hypothetical protein TNCV_457541 [Trichonephila clavipes]|nr:hypothetical protein TNCV_457541 [Trichonephila clavipes]